jgi:hypothetical protein
VNRIALYYTKPQADRWISGDHRWRRIVRQAIRGPDKVGGIDYVFLNLRAGLEKIGVEHIVNPSMSELKPSDWVGVIGPGKASLEGYTAPNPILAGVAVAEHPAAWPTLFDDYPVAAYVVHCDWVKSMYDRWYGTSRVVTWPVGIDTDKWSPAPQSSKTIDFLVYDKIRWDTERVRRALLSPVLETLDRANLTYEIIRYGEYRPDDLAQGLTKSRALLFMCEHETQGLAYQQAMSAGLPILAWDPGQWLDPWRFRYGETYVPATSVPFFDDRCGLTFKTALDFPLALDLFRQRLSQGLYNPREYVMENLELGLCARKYLDLLEALNK